MQKIDGVKYYSIKEIVNKVNEETNINLKYDNSTLQRFYRRDFPHVLTKSDETNHTWRVYSEDILIEIIDYYHRKQKIREYLKKVTELRKENTIFINKYYRKAEKEK